MKKIYITLCNVFMCILPLYSMDLSQSRVDFSEEPLQSVNPFNPFESKQLEQNYKKQKNAIAKKQKAQSKISLVEWKNYQQALDKYNNSIPENASIKPAIQEKLSTLTKNIQQKERKAELAAFVAQSKEDRTIQDLQKYKESLQTYLANLPNPTLEREKKYRDIIQHIDLINKIDEYMHIDYTNFTIKELYEHLVSLNELRQQLHNSTSERYKKLDNKITEVTLYYRDKIKEKKEKELLEQKRLAQLKDEQDAQALNQQLDKEINKAEAELNKKAQAKRKAMQQEQQNLEKKRLELEQQRRIDELIRIEKEKQQREVQEKFNKDREENAKKLKEEKEKLYQDELDEVARRLSEEYEQENAKRWIPWITNQFNQTRQIVLNFVDTIRSTANFWWSWLTGK